MSCGQEEYDSYKLCARQRNPTSLRNLLGRKLEFLHSARVGERHEAADVRSAV